MDAQEKSLRERKYQGDNLKGLRTHPGWAVLISILTEEYVKARDDLDKDENPEARATIKAIKKLAERINAKIDWGNRAVSDIKKLFGQKTEGS